MSEPTTKAEREMWLKRLGKHTDRLLYGPQTMMGRLIDDVERLEAEVKRLDEVNTGLGSQILDLMQERDRALGIIE